MDELEQLMQALEGVTLFENFPGASGGGAEVRPYAQLTRAGIRISIGVEDRGGISSNSGLVRWEEAKKPGALLQQLDALIAVQNRTNGRVTLSRPVLPEKERT